MSEPNSESPATSVSPEKAFLDALNASGPDALGDDGDDGGDEDQGEGEPETEGSDEEASTDDAEEGVETQSAEEDGEGEEQAEGDEKSAEPGPIPYRRFKEQNEKHQTEMALLQQQMLVLQQQLQQQQAYFQEEAQRRQAMQSQQSQRDLETRAKQILQQNGMNPGDPMAVFTVMESLKRADLEAKFAAYNEQMERQNQEAQLHQARQVAQAQVGSAFQEALAAYSVPKALMDQAIRAGSEFMLQGYAVQQIVPHVIRELGLSELPKRAPKKPVSKADPSALKAIASRGNGSGRSAGSKASGATGPRPGQKVGDYLDETIARALAGADGA